MSCKKHLFITGSKGSGKSTLLKLILEENIDYSGLITRAIRSCGNVPDYIILEDILNPSVSAVIGMKNEQGSSVVPCLNGFECTGVEILKRCLENKSKWIVIDEIGFLENNALSFQNEIRACLDTKRVIAVLRKDSSPFLTELKSRQDAYIENLDYIE